MSKSTKKSITNAYSTKKILIIYDNNMKNQDLLKDIFNQLFDEIKLHTRINELFISDIQYIINDFIDNSELSSLPY